MLLTRDPATKGSERGERELAVQDLVLAHDFGTTGNKATLITPSGAVITSHYEPYPTEYPQPGWAEQRPRDWQTAFVASTTSVLAKAELRPEALAAVTFSGHMLGCIPVAEDGRPLRDSVFLWADHRSQTQAEALEQRIGWESFYRRTGGGLELALYPAAKQLWIKENEPAIFRAAHRFVGTKDFLVHWLTGRFVTDYSDASNTGLLDLVERRWAKDYVNVLGLDIEKLPAEILPSTAIVGGVTPAAARETGLAAGTPVVLGGGDVPCAAVGAGVVAEGTAYNYIGSASWVAVANPHGVFDEVMRPFTLCHLAPGMYVSQLATYSAGVVHEWVKDQICLAEVRDARRGGTSAFDAMDAAAAESPAGANGLLFLPHMRGGGAPFHDLHSRGALLGLQLGHRRSDLLRAVLEGISLNIGMLCEALQQGTGQEISALRVIGGGAKSKLWLGILASVLGKRVMTLAASQEANCLGAAMTAYVGLSRFAGFEEAADAMIHVAEQVEPDPQAVPVYRARSRLFRDAYDAVSPIHGSLIAERRPKPAG